MDKTILTLTDHMKREPYIIQKRNRNICRHCLLLIRNGTPYMQAYAATAARYYLSEKRVRDIVREEREKKT